MSLYLLVGKDTIIETGKSRVYIKSYGYSIKIPLVIIANELKSDVDITDTRLVTGGQNEVFHIKYRTIYEESKKPVMVEYIIYELPNGMLIDGDTEIDIYDNTDHEEGEGSNG